MAAISTGWPSSPGQRGGERVPVRLDARENDEAYREQGKRKQRETGDQNDAGDAGDAAEHDRERGEGA